MKPAVWAQYEPDTTRFYASPGRSGTNKRAGLGQELDTVGKSGTTRLTLNPLNPLFYTKTCFSARFFRSRHHPTNLPRRSTLAVRDRWDGCADGPKIASVPVRPSRTPAPAPAPSSHASCMHASAPLHQPRIRPCLRTAATISFHTIRYVLV
jgi:hypothetical protein